MDAVDFDEVVSLLANGEADKQFTLAGAVSMAMGRRSFAKDTSVIIYDTGERIGIEKIAELHGRPDFPKR